MAHTRNTAKKCTGGSVPHVLLKISRVQLSGGDRQKMKASSTTRGALPVEGGDLEKRNSQHEALTATRAATSEDLEMRSVYNEYCILCRDGAEHHEDNTLFMCICCHLKMEQSAAYFGFYKSNSLPFLDKFLSVTGALEVSAQAEISAALVIFIHLILVDFRVAGSPFEFAHSFLKPYYSGNGIKYIEVYYNIGTDIIKGLKNSFTWECVVIGLSTHTDEDFRDPFAGYGDDSKGYVSTLVNDLPCQQPRLISWLARGCYLSWDLGSHSDIFLLTTVKEGGLNISRFAWANVEVHPWGNPLPIQCMSCGLVALSANLYWPTFLRLLHIMADWTHAIHTYYLQFLEDDEDRDLKEKIIQEGHKFPSGPGIVTVDIVRDREDDKPLDAVAFKTEFSPFDVTQKLFKEEIGEYDKKHRDTSDLRSMGTRTKLVQSWYNALSPDMLEELRLVAEKWNNEGAHSNVKDRKSNKPFTLASKENKKWAGESQDRLADWLTEAEYTVGIDPEDQSDKEDENLPNLTVHVDDEGYPCLPTGFESLILKNQQKVVRKEGDFYDSLAKKGDVSQKLRKNRKYVKVSDDEDKVLKKVSQANLSLDEEEDLAIGPSHTLSLSHSYLKFHMGGDIQTTDPKGKARKQHLPGWSSWTWSEEYLPQNMHYDIQVSFTALKKLKSYIIRSCGWGMIVVLGLGLLLYEARDDIPEYLGTSILSIQVGEKIEEAITRIQAKVEAMLPDAHEKQMSVKKRRKVEQARVAAEKKAAEEKRAAEEA
ncbi:hypothetical protein BDR06DRAFT_969145 [Suillus hirtellus]|nr:hypothetical protein BDR06DRAFT_969145 [Suillus hirtellus]